MGMEANVMLPILINQEKVVIEKLELLVNGKRFWLDDSLIVCKGKRYGLTGIDSSGKTTILKHIENGAMHIPANMEVLYWKTVKLDKKLTVFNAVIKASKNCEDLLDEYKKLKVQQELPDEQMDDYRKKKIRERLAHLKEQLLMLNPEGYTAKSKVEKILSGLGIPMKESQKTVKKLSKNLITRVNLARALFLEPDLLLLDEPTTGLDLDTILWLGNYLQVYRKALIIVSQDRCFLDKTCNEIIYINEQNMFHFKGNFSDFEKDCLSQQIQKFQLKANGKLGDAAVQTQSRVLTRSKSLEEAKMDKRKDSMPSIQQKPEFSFSDPVSPKVMDFVTLSEITFGYKGKAPLFVDLWEGINCRTRVAILGPSRAGKSTLLKLATKELCPQQGEVRLKDGIEIGCFGENSIRKLPGDKTPLQYIQQKALEQKDMKEKNLEQKVAEQLRRLGLVDSSISTKMEDLSDSEKARVSLAELCLIPHDCLFMDEPTRYLDIDMIDSLTKAINQFNGGLWMVSNNEYLIRETECELGLIDGGKLSFLIDFDDYKKKILSKLDEPVRGPFVYTRKTSSKIVTTPKLVSDSVSIENYISNSSVDPSIKEIGKYRIVFEEGTRFIFCYSPTLTTACSVSGKTKEICEEAIREEIERHIEELIDHKVEVPPPP